MGKSDTSMQINFAAYRRESKRSNHSKMKGKKGCVNYKNNNT